MGKWSEGEYDRVLVRKIKHIYDKAVIGHLSLNEEEDFRAFIEDLDPCNAFVQRMFFRIISTTSFGRGKRENTTENLLIPGASGSSTRRINQANSLFRPLLRSTSPGSLSLSSPGGSPTIIAERAPSQENNEDIRSPTEAQRFQAAYRRAMRDHNAESTTERRRRPPRYGGSRRSTRDEPVQERDTRRDGIVFDFVSDPTPLADPSVDSSYNVEVSNLAGNMNQPRDSRNWLTASLGSEILPPPVRSQRSYGLPSMNELSTTESHSRFTQAESAQSQTLRSLYNDMRTSSANFVASISRAEENLRLGRQTLSNYPVLSGHTNGIATEEFPTLPSISENLALPAVSATSPIDPGGISLASRLPEAALTSNRPIAPLPLRRRPARSFDMSRASTHSSSTSAATSESYLGIYCTMVSRLRTIIPRFALELNPTPPTANHGGTSVDHTRLSRILKETKDLLSIIATLERVAEVFQPSIRQLPNPLPPPMCYDIIRDTFNFPNLDDPLLLISDDEVSSTIKFFYETLRSSGTSEAIKNAFEWKLDLGDYAWIKECVLRLRLVVERELPGEIVDLFDVFCP